MEGKWWSGCGGARVEGEWREGGWIASLDGKSAGRVGG